MAWLILAAGGVETIAPENGERFSLEELCRLVGADTVNSLRLGATQVMFTAPRDRQRGLHNGLATQIAADTLRPGEFISGDAVLCASGEAPAEA